MNNLVNAVFLTAFIFAFSQAENAEERKVRVETRYGFWEMRNLSNGQIVPNEKSFQIDETTKTFLLDGQPFRYISGSIHYFRIPRTYWEDRLKRVRALGFNAIYYYIPWNLHETYEGKYDFSGSLDFVEFSRIAEKLGLFTILRIGPYVCGEWENGGIPYWLLKKNVKKLRSSDEVYTAEVAKWFRQLLPKIQPLLRKNGGPVLMLQIENEYGSYDACDQKYLEFLRDTTREIVGDSVLMFTTDGSQERLLKCGSVPGVLTTIDFGPTDNTTEISEYFKLQRKFDPTAPIVNSEYYPGWLVLWGQKTQSLPGIQTILNGAKAIYALGGNINFYMIHGGTNFGFWNGAETESPCITSYDYTAPISEAGDITPNYLEIRKWIKSLADWKNAPLDVPGNNEKFGYGNVKMRLSHGDFEGVLGGCVESESPVNFENLDHPMGLVAYMTKIQSGLNLSIPQFGDFAYVYVDKKFQGTLVRQYYNISKHSLDLDLICEGSEESSEEHDLFILVESQGRKTFETIIDHKGILSDVFLDGQRITKWKQCPINLPLQNSRIHRRKSRLQKNLDLNQKQGVFTGVLQVDKPIDTWINTQGWNKGIIIVNGHNVGRYWPTAGPQITLYVPKEFLKVGENLVIFVELEGAGEACFSSKSCQVEFIDHPVFNFEN